MTDRDTTRPTEVPNTWAKAAEHPWQFDKVRWSFESLAPPVARGSKNGHNESVLQSNSASVTSPPQALRGPEPTSPPAARRLGLKAWHALSHWEGVVEVINEDGFRLRLTPMVNGRPDFTRVEFADFDFEELAYPSDRELITPGATVYWTVGRRRDEAGTFSNQSLVRVRRRAPVSALRRRLAESEVAKLLGAEEPK